MFYPGIYNDDTTQGAVFSNSVNKSWEKQQRNAMCQISFANKTVLNNEGHIKKAFR